MAEEANESFVLAKSDRDDEMLEVTLTEPKRIEGIFGAAAIRAGVRSGIGCNRQKGGLGLALGLPLVSCGTFEMTLSSGHPIEPILAAGSLVFLWPVALCLFVLMALGFVFGSDPLNECNRIETGESTEFPRIPLGPSLRHGLVLGGFLGFGLLLAWSLPTLYVRGLWTWESPVEGAYEKSLWALQAHPMGEGGLVVVYGTSVLIGAVSLGLALWAMPLMVLHGLRFAHALRAALTGLLRNLPLLSIGILLYGSLSLPSAVHRIFWIHYLRDPERSEGLTRILGELFPVLMGESYLMGTAVIWFYVMPLFLFRIQYVSYRMVFTEPPFSAEEFRRRKKLAKEKSETAKA
jgi:hypothetical protein